MPLTLLHDKVRRRTVEDCLRAYGVDSTEPIAFARLRECMESMGPLFAAFGLYLSSRLDLLPEALCEELNLIRDERAPMPPDTVRAIFAKDVGCAPERAFLRFDPAPFEVRLFWQGHNASLRYASGADSDVIVRIIHPGIEAWVDDSDLLWMFAGSLMACGATASQVKRGIEDFGREAAAACSFENDMRAAELLEQDAEASDVAAAPGVLRHLCRAHVAVLTRSATLEESAPAESPELARTLCAAWFRHALQGFTYQTDPYPRNVAFSPEGRLRFHTGPFAALPEKAKTNLWAYLIALDGDDINGAYDHLAQEVAVGVSKRLDEELRRRFRQLASYRSHPLTESFTELSDEHNLGDQVLCHWRLASEIGVVDANLTSFYRGLYAMVRTIRRLAPGRDILSEALYDLRLMTVFDQVKQMVRPSEMAGLMESYATAMLAMPQQIDGMLASAGSGRRPVHSDRLPASGRGRGTVVVSLLLAFAGVAMLLHKIASPASGATVDRILAVAFAGFGLVLLRMGSRVN